eukprot:tig00020629_g12403.t1
MLLEKVIRSEHTRTISALLGLAGGAFLSGVGAGYWAGNWGKNELVREKEGLVRENGDLRLKLSTANSEAAGAKAGLGVLEHVFERQPPPRSAPPPFLERAFFGRLAFAIHGLVFASRHC